jgi:hypothetical protein
MDAVDEKKVTFDPFGSREKRGRILVIPPFSEEFFDHMEVSPLGLIGPDGLDPGCA